MTEQLWPDIAVIIPTFNRAIIVTQTIRALKKWLRYPGTINYYLGIDGTDQTLQVVQEAFNESIHCLIGHQTGLGGNLNRLILDTKESILLQLDDDHLLLQPLNLTPHVKELYSNDRSGWIRLMGIGSHHYTARLIDQYWRIDWTSPELYIPSNRPHIKHRRFIEQYGLYPENVTLAWTEETYCHHCKRTARDMHYQGCEVLVPLNSNSETAWDHVGESWQGKGY